MSEEKKVLKASLEEKDKEEGSSRDPEESKEGALLQNGEPVPQREIPVKKEEGLSREEAASSAVEVAAANLETFQGEGEPGSEKKNLNLLMDVSIPVVALLGRTEVVIEKALKLAPGSVIELDRFVGEPLDILINNKRIAKGDVVVVGEHYGIRITKILEPGERIEGIE